jgi:hypothetical protein
MLEKNRNKIRLWKIICFFCIGLLFNNKLGIGIHQFKLALIKILLVANKMVYVGAKGIWDNSVKLKIRSNFGLKVKQKVKENLDLTWIESSQVK